METTESIDRINEQLRNVYGVDTISGHPMWRVVWANDQYEKRHDTFQDHTTEGFFIREVTETRTVPKYPDKKDLYVLENLQGVPLLAREELAGINMSYEPIWTFTDRHGNYLPPYFEGCQFVINHVYERLGKKLPPEKHPDSGKSREQMLEEENTRLNAITDELFGEQSQITERHGDTVILNSSGKLN